MALIGQPAASPVSGIPTSRFPLSLPLIAWRTGSLAVGIGLVSTVCDPDDVVLDGGCADAMRPLDLALVAIPFEDSLATGSMLG